MHKQISTHPLITALSAEYAKEIKALKEAHEEKIEALYLEFRQRYQCLKQIIEDRAECSADSTGECLSAAPTDRHSCRVTNHYE